jgi:hypothetical protein
MCPHAELGIPETAHGPTLEYHQLPHGSSTHSLTGLRSHHYRELPEPLQAELGPFPDGFMQYFRRRFPNLLLHVFRYASLPYWTP